MEENNKHIDDLFRDGLGNYTETPPPAVWDALEKRLDNHRRKRFPIWWWYVLVFVLVSVGVIVARMAIDNTENKKVSNNAVNKELNTSVYKTDKTTATQKPPADTATPQSDNNTNTGLKAAQHAVNKDNKTVEGIQRRHVHHAYVGSHKSHKLHAGSLNPKSADKQHKAISSNTQHNSRKKTTVSKPLVAHNHTKKAFTTKANKTVATHSKTQANNDTLSAANSHVATVTSVTGKNTQPSKSIAKVKGKKSRKTAGAVKSITPKAPVAAQGQNIAATPSKSPVRLSAKTIKTSANKIRNKTTPVTPVDSNSTPMDESTVTAVTKAEKSTNNTAKKKAVTTTHPNKSVTATSAVANAKPVNVTPKTSKKSSVNVTAAKAKTNLQVAKAETQKNAPANTAAEKPKHKAITVKPAAAKKTTVNLTTAKTKAKPVSVRPAVAKKRSVNNQPAKAVKPLPIVPQAATANKQGITTTSATFKNKSTKTPTEKNATPPINNTKNISGTFKNVPPEQPAKFSREGIPVNTNATFAPPNSKAATAATERNKLPDFLAVNPMDPNSGGGGRSAGGNNGNDISPSPANQKNKKSHWSAGVKVGYEKGMGQFSADKYVFSPFLQYSISPTVSLLLQPGIKPVHVKNTSIDGPASYFQYTNPYPTESDAYITDTAGTVDSIKRSFTYNGSYDSFSIKHTINKTYLEIELPILVQIKLSRGLSFQGGISMMYSKIIGIQTDSFSTTINPPSYTLTYPYVSPNTPVPTPPDISTIFPHNTQSYSNYTPSNYQNSPYNPLRFGYMIGFSYSLWDRLLLDVMLQQSLTNINYLTNQNIKSIYNQPYLRFTIGYKFLRSNY